MMRKFSTRIRQLERLLIPKRQRRIVVRCEGPGSENFPQPTPEEMAENPVLTIRFVAAKDGRPLES